TVIRNLMSNAIKFTNKGGVILIDMLKNSDDPMEQKFFVRDNGVGMTPDVMEKIFKVGEAKSTNGTGGETGTGLGLILCKEFIEMHGGRLNVDSEVGKGTSFYFTIPKKDVGSSDVA
ncbi:MAG: ATP-binding protein, partial [Candidatus Kapabacteria bacterium]|nr:ATP-binding protein [Candidatus Kapabacteria bacterium]